MADHPVQTIHDRLDRIHATMAAVMNREPLHPALLAACADLAHLEHRLSQLGIDLRLHLDDSPLHAQLPSVDARLCTAGITLAAYNRQLRDFNFCRSTLDRLRDAGHAVLNEHGTTSDSLLRLAHNLQRFPQDTHA